MQCLLLLCTPINQSDAEIAAKCLQIPNPFRTDRKHRGPTIWISAPNNPFIHLPKLKRIERIQSIAEPFERLLFEFTFYWNFFVNFFTVYLQKTVLLIWVWNMKKSTYRKKQNVRNCKQISVTACFSIDAD